MYIIFLLKGREYILNQANQVVYIDYQKNAKVGELITADKILFCNGEFRQSFLTNIKLNFKVLKEENKEKITIFHYKPKKRYKKMKVHKQIYTKVKLESTEGIQIDQ